MPRRKLRGIFLIRILQYSFVYHHALSYASVLFGTSS